MKYQPIYTGIYTYSYLLEINVLNIVVGHEMIKCLDGEEGYECKQCGDSSFQPNSNRLGDKCRLRKSCSGPYQDFADYGSTVADAHCKCTDGYHFENEDQRACVPNRVCGKGYGQGTYGVCEFCLTKQMYSDTEGRVQRCKPLTNCEKNNRCVVKKSNGTFDNVCGPVVKDTNDCSSVVKGPEDSGVSGSLALILGASFAVFVIIAIVVVLILCLLRRRKQRRRGQKPLTSEHLEMLKARLLEQCEKDDALCKKTISTSFRVIEDRIDRQIWTLPQELFRSHYQPGRYEILVEKYKESQEKYAVNGYLREWREWKGCNQESVTELFHCLGQCKRDDIIYEICNKLRDDIDITFDEEAGIDANNPSNRAKNSFMSDIVDIFFPCLKSPSKDTKNRKAEGGETTDKLLEMKSCTPPDVDVKSAGNLYRERAHPSAPVFSDDSNSVVDPQLQGYDRQFSCPVQCTT
ncbi:hypothetical protein LOTGIDRAFT_231120 [Lottia gigantea]|uniref:TNFR-Cys domain-containing protein n=1 Tax=Lottia gigantea TaxID=225164 RepID=V4CCB4_LOTGI|nr:hypothetical protein LOTGIDRAFT_231120 [Lottia gigantea]ESO99534.1 hypothetical protein LOTGIDRAFT_231120 [Lottia gigantea]